MENEPIYYIDYMNDKRLFGEKHYLTDENCKKINKYLNHPAAPQFGLKTFPDDRFCLVEVNDGIFDFFYGERGLVHDLKNIDNIYDAIEAVCFKTYLEVTGCHIKPDELEEYLYNLFNLEKKVQKRKII